MPIHCPVEIKPLDAAPFQALDFRVMGYACASQNEHGHLCGTTEPEIKGKGMHGKGMVLKEYFPSSFPCRTFLCLQLSNAHSLSC